MTAQLLLLLHPPRLRCFDSAADDLVQPPLRDPDAPRAVAPEDVAGAEDHLWFALLVGLLVGLLVLSDCLEGGEAIGVRPDEDDDDRVLLPRRDASVDSER